MRSGICGRTCLKPPASRNRIAITHIPHEQATVAVDTTPLLLYALLHTYFRRVRTIHHCSTPLLEHSTNAARTIVFSYACQQLVIFEMFSALVLTAAVDIMLILRGVYFYTFISPDILTQLYCSVRYVHSLRSSTPLSRNWIHRGDGYHDDLSRLHVCIVWFYLVSSHFY
jgi:hypothetical protein